MDTNESCKKFSIYRHLCSKSAFYSFTFPLEDAVYCAGSLINLVQYSWDMRPDLYSDLWEEEMIYKNHPRPDFYHSEIISMTDTLVLVLPFFLVMVSDDSYNNLQFLKTETFLSNYLPLSLSNMRKNFKIFP